MGKHILFLFIYIGIARLLPAEYICMVMILHCVLSLISDVQQKKPLYLLTPFYGGVILSMIANIALILKVKFVGIPDDFMYFYIQIANAEEAMLILCIGNTATFIGYELFAKKSFPAININVTNKRIIKNIYIFIIVFTLLNVMGYTVSLAAFGGGVQKVMSLLIVIGILFYARLWGTENSKQYRSYAISLCVMQTVLALFNSYLRSELITPVVALAAGYFVGKGSFKYLFSYRIMPLAAAIVVFSIFFQTLGGHRAHFIDAFKENAGQDRNNSSYIVQDEEADNGGLLQRNANVAQVTSIVKLVQENGHYNGRASAPLAAALVPRFLWPDKPLIQLGVWFALEIGVASVSESGYANNSVNMTIPGELYLDFGYLGVLIGGLIFGGLIAAFWNASRFISSPYNLTGTLWGGYLLLYALGGIGADLQIIISLTSTFIVFVVIKKILDRNANTSLRPAVEGK